MVKEVMAFKQTLEGSEEISHAKIFRESIPSNRIRRCKGPEAGVCWSVRNK